MPEEIDVVQRDPVDFRLRRHRHASCGADPKNLLYAEQEFRARLLQPAHHVADEAWRRPQPPAEFRLADAQMQNCHCEPHPQAIEGVSVERT